MGGIDNPLTPNLDEEECDKAVFDERGGNSFVNLNVGSNSSERKRFGMPISSLQE